MSDEQRRPDPSPTREPGQVTDTDINTALEDGTLDADDLDDTQILHDEGSQPAPEDVPSCPTDGRTHHTFTYWVASRVAASEGWRDTAGMTETQHSHMPSDVRSGMSLFDRFAEHASDLISRAWFFAFCVLLVLLWLPSYFLIGTIDTWQLVINTLTTIVTFLMVALLQNSQTRANNSLQDKLNAIAAALAELMETESHNPAVRKEIQELREAVGLEDREGT